LANYGIKAFVGREYLRRWRLIAG